MLHYLPRDQNHDRPPQHLSQQPRSTISIDVPRTWPLSVSSLTSDPLPLPHHLCRYRTQTPPARANLQFPELEARSPNLLGHEAPEVPLFLADILQQRRQYGKLDVETAQPRVCSFVALEHYCCETSHS